MRDLPHANYVMAQEMVNPMLHQWASQEKRALSQVNQVCTNKDWAIIAAAFGIKEQIPTEHLQL